MPTNILGIAYFPSKQYRFVKNICIYKILFKNTGFQEGYKNVEKNNKFGENKRSYSAKVLSAYYAFIRGVLHV
jgi:hypothetical protein